MFLVSFLLGPFSLLGRTVAGCLLGGIFSIFFCWLFIKYGNRFIRSGVREAITDLHAHKDKTPTMGGVPCLCALFCALLLVGGLRFVMVWQVLVAALLFGGLGFWDDLQKIRRGRGISERTKFIGQLIISSGIITWMIFSYTVLPTLVIPLFGYYVFNIGLLFVPWAIFIMVGTNNAVNITDGLDGLAALLLIINFFFFAVVALCSGYFDLLVFAMTMCGVLAGFLWYNAHPAQLFMGDVGSLGFGGALATMALLLKSEVLLSLTGIIFVIETLSVMVQVFMVQRYHKRLLKMAPLHHHLELSGIPETRIVARFVLITAFISLLTLVAIARSVCGV